MISQKQKMKMQQKLTPQQLMLMGLLQLPVTSLEQRIKEEMEKNPMLEVDSNQNGESDYNEGDGRLDDGNSDNDNDFNGIDIDEYYDDDDYSYREREERDKNIETRYYEPGNRESFTESLLRQLSMQNLTEREHTIATEIIGCIDGSGYLGRDLQLIANDMAFRKGIEVEEEEIERILKIVQSFDPAGVGARNLQENLSIQLHRMPSDETTDLAITIVEKYFGHLSNRRYSVMAKALKVDEATLNAAINKIRHLNPKPGWGRDEENRGAHYILPDFIVSNEGDSISFTLNDRNTPRLQISETYSDIRKNLTNKKRNTEEERKTLQFITSKTEAAQQLIEALEQRQQTLAIIMSAIISYQKEFFLTGDNRNLRPMKLKDIAEKTGFDESTVSRVVNHKYVQTKHGTILLKELFSKAVMTESGDITAIKHIKEVLKHIIDKEDKSNPLSDEALSTELKKNGYNISRRTVTKYRESMDIPVQRLRKELQA
ncbi:MAG: RNA polymerase factor sigma-54 [Bacteroidales bacterium]|nr:RNA polymerase factor sigma-54 [Bacteroidales bacterium]